MNRDPRYFDRKFTLDPTDESAEMKALLARIRIGSVLLSRLFLAAQLGNNLARKLSKVNKSVGLGQALEELNNRERCLFLELCFKRLIARFPSLFSEGDKFSEEGGLRQKLFQLSGLAQDQYWECLERDNSSGLNSWEVHVASASLWEANICLSSKSGAEQLLSIFRLALFDGKDNEYAWQRETLSKVLLWGFESQK